MNKKTKHNFTGITIRSISGCNAIDFDKIVFKYINKINKGEDFILSDFFIYLDHLGIEIVVDNYYNLCPNKGEKVVYQVNTKRIISIVKNFNKGVYSNIW